MLIESVLLAILFGKIRGGKFSRLSHLEFKKVWVFILALILQGSIILFGVNGNEFVLKYIKELYIISYVLLFIGIVINFKHRSLLIILLGAGLNIFVMFNNGWKTPISIDGLLLAGYSDLADIAMTGKLAFYTPLEGSSKFGYLGKIITVPPPYFYPQLLSIGDIFITLGLFLFIQSIMTNESYDRTKMIRFKYRSKI
ncbi:hypothetical protein SAMN05660462_02124 [Proteiniborus ethanoligenes]|uniref:DUF5317 domain-containing protein n=1 Tax=Proteiniborus ethanoligenes TaxID=415015 RepID=A0A1H3QYA0_9FIRM|nr:DUF5317 domain-containing protein [Proteiniborus ethanoligenes]SDZ18025.1 hypothetical protein SAMN05660462_02124 [Proteiniborus ethanoligenes]